jgi:anti-repressor protein
MTEITMRMRTMDSREIAELTGKDHSNVCRDIRGMLETCGIPRFRFESGYLDAQGQKRTCYRIPGHELMLLLTGYSVPLRDKVLKRWEELEREASGAARLEAPKGSELLALAVLEADRMIKEKDAIIAELEPKAYVADRIAGAMGMRTLSEVGKVSGIGPHRIFELLEEKGIIFKHNGRWLPYQCHIEAGRFVVRETTYQGSTGADHLVMQTYVTPKGEVWLARQFFKPQDPCVDIFRESGARAG